jgi:hypothetical protein
MRSLLDRIRRALRVRHAAKERVHVAATTLITESGDAGYYQARERARASRRAGDRADTRFWTAVALEIHRRRRLVTGLKGWDSADLKPPRDIATP